ncbi:DUF445 family protein [Nocardia yamanashiensis]|uniref:DUF445 domain-containing protein n=1 Tax=Nocardia yamanashiensis TaxID=209247 RepID=UPI001E3E3CAF|nr:DUF445 family protein [Nocardia yamanashiensis]UGT38829.1 DUF445 family protein [Nocardia yamanashiensis]
MTWSGILADVHEHWLTYALMPVFAALIGYLTKLVAVEMLFKPLEFKGIPPYLGWQGLIPRYAARMATVAVDLMLSRLVDPQEIIDRIDPEALAEHLRAPMLETIEEVVDELMMRHQPALWVLLPDAVRRMLIRRIHADAPRLIGQMMDDLKVNIDLVFDLRTMAIDALLRDKALTVRLIREVAAPEMRFIVRSGLLFGSILGVAQAITWALTQSTLIMPLFGAFVGYFTDWLALQMIFRPIQPRRFLGIFRWQGMFHARRDEVAVDYGGLIAAEIVTPDNIMHAMLAGPQSDRLFSLIEYEIRAILDQQLGRAKPVVEFAFGGGRLEALHEDLLRTVRDRLPESAKQLEDYTTEALGVSTMIIEKMRLLTNEEYEDLLRPAFKQDEWKIVLVGAILGFLVGELQVHLLLS